MFVAFRGIESSCGGESCGSSGYANRRLFDAMMHLQEMCDSVARGACVNLTEDTGAGAGAGSGVGVLLRAGACPGAGAGLVLLLVARLVLLLVASALAVHTTARL